MAEAQKQVENTAAQNPVQANTKDFLSSYALFQTGGKQYQAVVGQTIAIEKLEGEVGDAVEFTDVLLRKLSADKIEIGTPYLDTPIKASIVRQMQGPKIVIFKFKRRQKSRVKKGHRQLITVVRIETI